MKKILSLILLSTMLLSLFVGCSMEPPFQQKAGAKETGKVKVGLSLSTLNNPFFVTLKAGAEEKAKELGIELVVVDAQDNPAKQANDVEDLIQKNVDVLLINPTDSDAVGSAVSVANQKGIPVITVDRVANSGEVLSHVASDNIGGGEMAGQYVLDLVGEGKRVVELEGVPGSSAARERGTGFNKVVDGKVKIVAKQTANFDRAQGLTVMENIIQSVGKIDAVFAHNDEMALGAYEALKAAGLSHVKVVGFDATDDAVKSVENGALAGTIAQKPELIGIKSMEAAFDAANGKEIEKSIPIELALIKK